MVAVYNPTRPTALRLRSITMDEDGMLVHQPPQQAPPITATYSNCIIMHFNVNCRSAGKQTQARALKPSRSSGSSLSMVGAVLKLQRSLDEVKVWHDR